MKKKILSIILAFAVVLGLCAGITSISVIANADTEISVKALFGATNTYEIKGEITKIDDYSVYHNQMGYDNPQYSFEYDLSTKNGNTTTTVPHVTVFTHGYDAWGKDWCNNAENLPRGASFNDLNFEYSVFSMVHQVATEVYTNNAVVVRAIMEKDSQENSDYKITIEQEYCDNPNFLKPDSELTMENINEIGNYHLIVIFDGDKTKGSNNNIYYQFNYMLSTILYKLKPNYNGKIPKVNLIGHSRGGITNMQYALDHPDIVANLISLGTPYEGSTTATIVKDDKYYKGDGINDIINPDIYNGYKERWNNGYNTLYKDINFLAIGSYSTLPFFCKVAHNDRSGEMFNFWSALLVDVGTTALTALNFTTNSNATMIAIRIITRILNKIFSQNVATSIVELLLNEVRFTEYGMVWLSDAIIPLGIRI